MLLARSLVSSRISGQLQYTEVSGSPVEREAFGGPALSWPKADRVQRWRGLQRSAWQHAVWGPGSAPYLPVKASGRQAHSVLVGSHDLRRRNGHQQGGGMASRNPGPALSFQELLLLTWKLTSFFSVVTLASTWHLLLFTTTPCTGHLKPGAPQQPLNWSSSLKSPASLPCSPVQSEGSSQHTVQSLSLTCSRAFCDSALRTEPPSKCLTVRIRLLSGFR